MNTQKVQASQYDKIGRENMRAELPGIIEKVLEIDIVKIADNQTTGGGCITTGRRFCRVQFYSAC